MYNTIMSGELLAALIAAAPWAPAGLHAPIVPQPIPLIAGRHAEPRRLLTVSLIEIAEQQHQAELALPVGGALISFSLAFGPEQKLWAKIRQGPAEIAYPLERLASGVEELFPAGPYRFTYANGLITAWPLDESRPPAVNVSAAELLERLHQAALMITFLDRFDYAVLYEDGNLIPASVTLLSREKPGVYKALRRSTDELRELQWFLEHQVKRVGMRLEEDGLAFYDQPAR